MPMYKKQFTVYGLRFTVISLLISSLFIGGCARKTPERLWSDAGDAARQYDFALAITKLEQFLDLYPHDPRAVRAQFEIGAMHMKLGQFDLAIQEFQKVIQKYPASGEANIQAQFAIANCYVNEKKLDKAEEIWTKLSMDTTRPLASVDAKLNIAKANEMQNNWTGAEKEYREVLASFPLPKELLPKGYPKEADERGILDATQALGMVLFKEGKTDKAIEMYKSLQNKYPNSEYAQGISIWSNVIIGDIYTQQKQPKKAADSYQKAIGQYAAITTDKLVPDKACWAMTRMGEIYELHLMDTTKAVTIYKEAIKDYPKTQFVRYAQNALMRIAKPTAAQDTTKRSIPAPVGTVPKK